MESKTCSTTIKERKEKKKKRRKSGRDRKKCVSRSESWRPMMAVKEAVVASSILLQCCSSGTNERAHTYTMTKRKSWVQSYRFFRIASAPVGVFTLRVCMCACSLFLCRRLEDGKSQTCVRNDDDQVMSRNMIFGYMHTRTSKSNVVFRTIQREKEKWWMNMRKDGSGRMSKQRITKEKFFVIINILWNMTSILWNQMNFI